MGRKSPPLKDKSFWKDFRFLRKKKPDAERGPVYGRMLMRRIEYFRGDTMVDYTRAVSIKAVRGHPTIEANDVCYETLYIFYCNCKSIRVPQALKGWLRGTAFITRDKMLAQERPYNRGDLDKTLRGLDDHQVKDDELPPPSESAEQLLARSRAILAVIEKMPPRLQPVAQLVLVEKLENDEIAAILGLAAGSVRGYRKQIRDHLMDLVPKLPQDEEKS